MTELHTVRLRVSGMSCPGCVNNVKKALSAVAGVTSAEIDLKTGEAIIQSGIDSPDVACFIAAVKKAGFDAVVL